MNSRALLALTASALALPGITPSARGDAPPAFSTASLRVSTYKEDDLDSAARLAGSEERYDIDITQLRLQMPVGDNYALTLNSSYESMSGASPWYTIRQADGSTGVIMSGATISEQRRDFSANVRRYLDNGAIGVTLGGSHENDYDALSGSIDGERHFNDNLTTVAAGFSYSSDELDPTQHPAYVRILGADKRSRSLFVSVSQITNQNNLVQTGLSVTQLTGYLSDPYKLNDKRPDERTQFAWTTAWRHFIPAANAALQADYRFYHDDFGIDSHTVDLAWHQNLGSDWQIVPGIRYYSQRAADFFTQQLVFGPPAAQPYQSTDYRLSNYGAWSGSLKVQWEIDAFTVSASAERYFADADFASFDGLGSPALVDFTRLSFGLDFRF
ncbi:MAG: DUF3570 domain-containing protein [Pseudomonadota bacterium]|nr:DUF3570 domain-containing protein [Pseudomonadota bacterium]